MAAVRGQFETVQAPDVESARAERLFWELDHRRIGDGLSGWVVEILGIHVSTNTHWIQIAPPPDVNHSLVLQVPSSATPGEALAALIAWANSPVEHRRQVVSVVQFSEDGSETTLDSIL